MEKPLPEISGTEKLFDIPDNWRWEHLGNIISLYSGKESPKEEPKLAIKRIQNMVTLLPPLAEHKRIVANLEELLPLYEKLK